MTTERLLETLASIWITFGLLHGAGGLDIYLRFCEWVDWMFLGETSSCTYMIPLGLIPNEHIVIISKRPDFGFGFVCDALAPDNIDPCRTNLASAVFTTSAFERRLLLPCYSVFAHRKVISTDEAALVVMCDWLAPWFLLGYLGTK